MPWLLAYQHFYVNQKTFPRVPMVWKLPCKIFHFKSKTWQILCFLLCSSCTAHRLHIFVSCQRATSFNFLELCPQKRTYSFQFIEYVLEMARTPFHLKTNFIEYYLLSEQKQYFGQNFSNNDQFWKSHDLHLTTHFLSRIEKSRQKNMWLDDLWLFRTTYIG